MWQAIPYDLPLARPYTWAKGVQTRRAGLLVRHGRDEQVGWGECAPPPHESVAYDLAAYAAPTLAGVDAKGPPARLRCAISGAWWDVEARLRGEPLAASLARFAGTHMQDEVKVNALIGAVGPEEAAAAARAAVAAGHDTIKIKCMTDDEARVAAVREAAPHAALRLDPNGAWDDPATMLRRLVDHDIAYVEDPAPPEECAALADCGIPIALDAPIDGPGALLDWSDVCDVVILKPQRVGGPDHAVLCAQVARSLGLKPVVTNSLESAIGLTQALHVAAAAGIEDACGLGTAAWFARDVATPPTLTAGRMRIRGPGLGVAPEGP